MTQRKNSSTQPIHPVSLGKRMLQGGGIALILISLFLFGAGEPDPDWGKLWMIKPLVIVPLFGSFGGLFYYFMDHLAYQGGWNKTLAIILTLIVYTVALWLGTVLGLNGTWWD